MNEDEAVRKVIKHLSEKERVHYISMDSPYVRGLRLAYRLGNQPKKEKEGD